MRCAIIWWILRRSSSLGSGNLLPTWRRCNEIKRRPAWRSRFFLPRDYVSCRSVLAKNSSEMSYRTRKSFTWTSSTSEQQRSTHHKPLHGSASKISYRAELGQRHSLRRAVEKLRSCIHGLFLASRASTLFIGSNLRSGKNSERIAQRLFDQRRFNRGVRKSMKTIWTGYDPTRHDET
jgi:hypothetical protein